MRNQSRNRARAKHFYRAAQKFPKSFTTLGGCVQQVLPRMVVEGTVLTHLASSPGLGLEAGNRAPNFPSVGLSVGQFTELKW